MRYKRKTKKHGKTLENMYIFLKARNDATKVVENRGPKILEAKRITKQGTGLKILTPKQMLQRLPIALAQIKSGNNSESLWHTEIRQITIYE